MDGNIYQFRFIEMMESTFALFLLFDVGLGFILHASSCVMVIIFLNFNFSVLQCNLNVFFSLLLITAKNFLKISISFAVRGSIGTIV